MSPGRVLLVVNDFPPILGGESTLYHALARHMDPTDTLVLAPSAPGDQEVDEPLAVEVARRWLPEYGGTARRIARAVVGGGHLAALAGKRPLRYLICGQLLSLGVPTRLVAGSSQLPYAVIVHGADLCDYHDRFPWSRLVRWVIAGADAVVVNSRFTGDLVHRLLPRAARRVIVLPMGVDPAPPIDAARLAVLRERYGLTGGPVLLSVARLLPMKGQDRVMAALPRLAPRFPGIKYIVVGAGPHLSELRRLAAAAGVAERVIFAGAVSERDLHAHYDLATLFVQLSRDTGKRQGVEGFGLTFLEAASHALPSIAGSTGGIGDAVLDGESGVLIPPEEEAFVSAASRLLANEDERRRMAAAARRWAAAHTWEKTTRCVEWLTGSVESRAA